MAESFEEALKKAAAPPVAEPEFTKALETAATPPVQDPEFLKAVADASVPTVDPAVEADRIMRRDHPYLARARELWKAPTDFFGHLSLGIQAMAAKAVGQTPTPPMHTLSDAMEMKWAGAPRDNTAMAQINAESGKEFPVTRAAADAVGPTVAYLLAPKAMLPQFGFSAVLMGTVAAGQAAEMGEPIAPAFAQGVVSGMVWQGMLSSVGKLPIPKFFKPVAGATATYGLVKAEGGSDKEALEQSVIMLGLGTAHLVVEAAAAKGKVQKFPRVEATPEEAIGHAKLRISTLEAITTGHPEMEMPGGGKVPAEEARPLTEAESTELNALKGMLADPPALAKSLGLTLVTAHTAEPMERLQVTLEKIAEEEKADAVASAAEKKAKAPKKVKAEKPAEVKVEEPKVETPVEAAELAKPLAQGPKIGVGGQVGEAPAESVAPGEALAPEPPAPSKPAAELEKAAVETPAPVEAPVETAIAVEAPDIPPPQEVVTPAAKPSNNILNRNDDRTRRVFEGKNTPADDAIISAMDPRFLAKRWLASPEGSPERAVAESNLLVKLSPWLKKNHLEAEAGKVVELLNSKGNPLKKLLADPETSLEKLLYKNLTSAEGRHETTIKAGTTIDPTTGEAVSGPVKVKQGVTMPVTEEGRELSLKTPGRELDPAEALDRKEAAEKAAAAPPPPPPTERFKALDAITEKLLTAQVGGAEKEPLHPSKLKALRDRELKKAGFDEKDLLDHIYQRTQAAQGASKLFEHAQLHSTGKPAERGDWLISKTGAIIEVIGPAGDGRLEVTYHTSEGLKRSWMRRDLADTFPVIKARSHSEAAARATGGELLLPGERSKEASRLTQVAIAAGVKRISWYKGKSTDPAMRLGDGTILLNHSKPAEALTPSFAHEFTHDIQRRQPELHKALEDWVLENDNAWAAKALESYGTMDLSEAVPTLIGKLITEQSFLKAFSKSAPELYNQLVDTGTLAVMKSVIRDWFKPRDFIMFSRELGGRTGTLFSEAIKSNQMKSAQFLGEVAAQAEPSVSPAIAAARERLVAAKAAKDAGAVTAIRAELEKLGDTKADRAAHYRRGGRTPVKVATPGAATESRTRLDALRKLRTAIDEYGPKNPKLVATLLQPYLRPDGSVADPAGAFLALNRLKGEKIGLPAVAQAFGSEDLTNAAKGSFAALQSLGTSIMRTFAPAARGPIAVESAEVLRQEHGRLAREDAQRADHIKAAAAEVDKLTKKYGQAVMDDFGDRINQGKKQLHPELQPLADALLAETKAVVKDMEALGTGATDQFRKDYFGRQWKQTKAAKALFTSLKALGGSKSFLKAQVLESTAQGRELGLEPVENNPVKMHAIKIGEMKKFIMATKVMQGYKSRGLIKQFKKGTAPVDWVPIRDDVGLKDVKDVNGKKTKGAFYGPEQLATVLNNDLSMGLRTHDWFRAYLGVGNVLNQATLGLSGFHLAFTSVDAAVSQVALGMREITKGSFKAAGRNFLSAPLAPITNALRGEQGRREYFHPGSVGGDVSRIINVITDAGGRYQSDPMYRTHLTDGLMTAWNKGNVLGTVGRALLLPFEAPTRLIMDQIVPRQKFGVAMDIVRAELQMNPGITHEALVKKAISAWDSADNRMGQMVYDNTFMHRIAKDLSLASIRSVGWNLGTFRELLGGSYDLLKQPTNLLRGKPVELTNRAAYTLALPVAVGMLGSAINYIFTGEPPQELRDAFFPRTGGIDESGNPRRISLPTYMKDVYHYATEPGKTLSGKVHPLLSGIVDMLNNKDFYGDKIRNSDDPLVQQLQQVAVYAVKSFEPLSSRNIRRSLEGGESLLSASKGLIGLNPAPKALNQTPAEQLLSKFTQAQMPAGGRDTETTDRRALRRQLLTAMRSKDEAQVKKVLAENSGKVTTNDVRELRKEASQPPIINQLKGSVTAEQALRAWKLMTPAERKLSKFVIVQKYRARMQASAPDDRKKLYQLFQDSGFFD
jgi:hypothetical protein